MADPFQLQRFVRAQDPVWEAVCDELRNGHKTTHWMWFVFPQISGLGLSDMSRRFAIASRPEAESYLLHPVLGPRLYEASGLVMRIEGQTVREIFGSPDDLKLRACMTLFANIAAEEGMFHAVLQKYFEGQQDPVTLEWLRLSR